MMMMDLSGDEEDPATLAKDCAEYLQKSIDSLRKILLSEKACSGFTRDRIRMILDRMQEHGRQAAEQLPHALGPDWRTAPRKKQPQSGEPSDGVRGLQEPVFHRARLYLYLVHLWILAIRKTIDGNGVETVAGAGGAATLEELSDYVRMVDSKVSRKHGNPENQLSQFHPFSMVEDLVKEPENSSEEPMKDNHNSEMVPEDSWRGSPEIELVLPIKRPIQKHPTKASQVKTMPTNPSQSFDGPVSCSSGVRYDVKPASSVREILEKMSSHALRAESRASSKSINRSFDGGSSKNKSDAVKPKRRSGMYEDDNSANDSDYQSTELRLSSSSKKRSSASVLERFEVTVIKSEPESVSDHQSIISVKPVKKAYGFKTIHAPKRTRKSSSASSTKSVAENDDEFPTKRKPTEVNGTNSRPAGEKAGTLLVSQRLRRRKDN